MTVVTTKGLLCCEFEVRIEVDGSESEAEIAKLAQDVFREYEDVLLCKILDGDKHAVGELFPLTIANKDQLNFFIPRPLLRRLCQQIKDIREEKYDDADVSEDEYIPRNTLT